MPSLPNPLLKGFIRFPKEVDAAKHKARWFINVNTGEQLSRRSQQTLAKGGIRPEEVARIRKEGKVFIKGTSKTQGYNSRVRVYKEKVAKELGIKESAVKVRGNSPAAVKFRNDMERLKKFNVRETKNGIKSHMRTPAQEHELSRILKDLHLKDENDNSKPGESPKPSDTV